MIIRALKNKRKLSTNNPNAFTFSSVLLGDVKEVMNLDVKKSYWNKSVPATSSKQSAHICLTFLTNSISHNSLHENTYSDELKQSEVISSYKKLGPLKKEN